MSEFLPKEVRAGLDAARQIDRRRKSRLRVHADDAILPVHRLWDTGFAIDAGAVQRLRGLVDIYDGTVHLWQCLIVASEEAAGELVYEFKRHTAAADRAPLDFARDEDVPVALIPRH